MDGTMEKGGTEPADLSERPQQAGTQPTRRCYLVVMETHFCLYWLPRVIFRNAVRHQQRVSSAVSGG